MADSHCYVKIQTIKLNFDIYLIQTHFAAYKFYDGCLFVTEIFP